jgi:signal transduction histidine kinase
MCNMQSIEYSVVVENVPPTSEAATITALRTQLEERERELREQSEVFAQRSRALEAHNANLSNEFAKVISVISHEMRTPLTSITGYIDLLADGDVGPVTTEQQEFLQIVRSSAMRLGQIITDVVDMSRIEAGKVELRFRSLDLKEQIARTVAMLQPDIMAQNHRVVLELAHDLPQVLGDENRVDQILNNVISNAYKYMPTLGTITVRAAQDGQNVRVDVEDTGVGLSPQQQQQVFDKFFRAKHHRTRSVEGSGLGLTLARSLLLMQGGDITVHSTEDHGSKFSFTLPVSPDHG